MRALSAVCVTCAEGLQHSSNILLAAWPPNILSKWTEAQPSGPTPRFLKGVEKEALSLARMTSQRAGAVVPLPIPGPLTAAMIGLGNSMNTLKHLSLPSCMDFWTVLKI